MKIEELTKEYKLSDEVTLSNGSIKKLSIIVSINNNSVSIKPNIHFKEFCFSTVSMTPDTLIEWECITKMMYMSSELIKKIVTEKENGKVEVKEETL